MVIHILTLAALFAAVTFLLAELCARMYIRVGSAKFARGVDIFWVRLPAYKGASFFCAKFSEEASKCVKLDYSEHKTCGYFGLEDFQGEFIRVKNGIRLTTQQPKKSDNTVWLFGGSSIFSRRTPDNETIASHLQILLNDQFGSRFSVENKGVPSMVIWEQVKYLRDTEILPGDVVIFFTGVSETNLQLFHSLKSSAQMRSPERLSRTKSLNRPQRAIDKLYWRYRDKISLARIFLDVSDRRPPVSITDERLFLKNMANLETDFYTAAVSAHKYCVESGSMFHLTLQPHLFMIGNPTRWEKKLLRSHRLVRPGIRESIEKGYEALHGVMKGLRENKVCATELSGLFENRPRGVEYFFDHCHVNHEGARIIAWKLFEIVFAAGDKP